MWLGTRCLKKMKKKAIDGTGSCPQLRAFTLFEVILLIAVFGLLVGVAVPNKIRADQNADVNRCRANLENLEFAVRKWAAKEDVTDGSSVTLQDIQRFTGKELPRCPLGGEYILVSVGEPPRCSTAGHGLLERNE